LYLWFQEIHQSLPSIKKHCLPSKNSIECKTSCWMVWKT
jgi:hypothetical protein